MVKILFLSFRVTDARLKNKKSPPLRVTNSIGALLFSHIRVTNVKLINEKFIKYYNLNVGEPLEIDTTP